MGCSYALSNETVFISMVLMTHESRVPSGQFDLNSLILPDISRSFYLTFPEPTARIKYRIKSEQSEEKFCTYNMGF